MPPKKILLIDDDTAMLDLYQMPFESSADFDIVTESSGRDGLVKAMAFKPDLILLDILMKRFDGFQVLEGLKKHADTASIPVVMLTNLSDPATIEKAKKMGALEYWNKSLVTPKEALEKAKKLLNVAS